MIILCLTFDFRTAARPNLNTGVYEGFVWEILGEGGVPAVTIYPVVPM